MPTASRLASTRIAACLLLAPGIAMAQSTSPNSSDDYIDLSKGGSIEAPDRIGGYRDITPAVQLRSADETIYADFALDIALAGKPKETTTDGITRIKGSFTNIAIKASVPLIDSEDNSVADFKNFGNDGKLTFSVNRFQPNVISTFDKEPYYNRFARRCIELAGSKWIRGAVPPVPPAEQTQIQAALMEFDARIAQQLPWDDALAQAAALDSIKAFGPVAMEACHTGNPAVGNNAGIARVYARLSLSPAEYSKWRRGFASEATTIFGIEGSVGYNKFGVLDRAAFKVRRPERLGFDVNARIGRIFSGAGVTASVGGGYTRSYDAKDEAEVCSAPDSMGQTTCIQGQDGKPDRKETGYVDGSLRMILLRGEDGLGKVAMAPRATYIFEDKAFEFKLPVYLQRSDAGGLDGGIQAIYNTDDKKVFVGAFIGVPFYGL